MMIIFHFMIIMLKTPILKVDLNGFFTEACDIGLKTILSSHFQMFSIYFYDTKVVQILYVTYRKLNAMTCFSIFLLMVILNLFSCGYIKILFHF
jgi:hypothetical protein